MSELKTKPTDGNVQDFLNSIEKGQKREDAFKILDLMKEVTEENPVMWGSSIIGFGTYKHNYASGREAE